MKTIGLLGGMSWESSAEYYRLINQRVKERLGGWHSAELLMYSVDFEPVKQLQHDGDWEAAARLLAAAARKLERGGAELLLLCTNTMHRVADEVAGAVSIPFIHLADATAEAIKARGLERVGLLGTRFTMEQEFYRGRLRDRHGFQVIVPEPDDRETVHRIIYDELVLGTIRDESREAYREIMARLAQQGAEGIILGCTEIELLVGPEDASVPLFATTRIHAEAAVHRALLVP